MPHTSNRHPQSVRDARSRPERPVGEHRGRAISKTVSVFLLTAACALGCAKQAPMRIHVETNPKVDLSLYRTYEWSTPEAPNRSGVAPEFQPAPNQTQPVGASDWAAERTDQQIRARADAQLERLGYVRDARPQILFSWHVSTRYAQIQDTWGDYARYRAEGGTEGAADAWIDGYEEGSLVIEARDARNRALLWYGTATAVVNPQLREKRIPEAVAEIFAQWPARSNPR